MTGRAWLVTGATAGLGRAIAEEALARGDRVAIAGRDRARAAEIAAPWDGRALALHLDVGDADAIVAAVAAAEAWSGGLDIVVNNAGRGLIGAIEEADEDEIAGVLAVNLLGPLRVARAALPALRARRRGCIVMIGSIAGRAGTPGSGLYSATKFALAGLAEALAGEVAPLGVRVMTVEPGALRTDIAGRSRIEARRRIADYDATAGRRREAVRAIDGKQAGDPQRAAAAILDALDADPPPARLVLGAAAFARALAQAAAQRDELLRWEGLSRAIDFPD
jgi:NAD(P)-dependent dehydrogenase (short-subunit alcohol dehydrogenase family)